MTLNNKVDSCLLERDRHGEARRRRLAVRRSHAENLHLEALWVMAVPPHWAVVVVVVVVVELGTVQTILSISTLSWTCSSREVTTLSE